VTFTSHGIEEEDAAVFLRPVWGKGKQVEWNMVWNN
jgi:hypothetical protein